MGRVRYSRVVWLAGAGLLLAACPSGDASAELVHLVSGRTLSVKSHRIEGGRATLVLRAGGEVDCDAALIAGVEPDEVPWPEPAAGAAATTLSPVVTAFDALIEPMAVRYGVESALVRAVVEAESAFQPGARSPKGAMGLMQLMPATARQYSVSDPYEPAANLEAGIRHLRSLLDRYDIRLALAAYNAGEATVQRHGGIPPYPETRAYVDRVLRRLNHYRGQPAETADGVTPPGQKAASVVPTS